MLSANPEERWISRFFVDDEFYDSRCLLFTIQFLPNTKRVIAPSKLSVMVTEKAWDFRWMERLFCSVKGSMEEQNRYWFVLFMHICHCYHGEWLKCAVNLSKADECLFKLELPDLCASAHQYSYLCRLALKPHHTGRRFSPSELVLPGRDICQQRVFAQEIMRESELERIMWPYWVNANLLWFLVGVNARIFNPKRNMRKILWTIIKQSISMA